MGLPSFYVFVDIFNSYGTQALRPITNKWIQLSVISTFDPIIFTLLCIGVLLWIVGVHPYLAFFPIVAILVVYYIVRFMMQATIKKKLKRIDRSHNAVKVFVAPTIKFHVWRVAIQTEQHDYVGTARWKDVEFTDKVKRQSMTPDTLLWKVKETKISLLS